MNITIAFLLAIISVESGGNNMAIGDSGKAYGCMQIHAICIRDVNRISGSSFVHKDAFDRKKSMYIAKVYLEHYCTEARLGHKPTLEDAARIFNGGPHGWKKESTLRYWEKVWIALERGIE